MNLQGSISDKMGIDAYKKVGAVGMTPKELNRNIFGSIALYLQDYKMTSNSKEFRIDALSKALVLIHFILPHYEEFSKYPEGKLIYEPLRNLAVQVTLAINIPNKITNFDDAIGFMRTLRSESL